jgi:hypothetical protein
MRTLAAALAIAIAAPSSHAFFRPNDFKAVHPDGEVAIGHKYQCALQLDFQEARPDLVAVTYTDGAACTASDALAMRYALSAAYCSQGSTCPSGPAPGIAADAGPFAKVGGSCSIVIFFDPERPNGLEIHWPGGCSGTSLLLGVRYATSAVLCARTTHCVSGLASADPDPNPKYYAPRGWSTGGKVLPTR